MDFNISDFVYERVIDAFFKEGGTDGNSLLLTQVQNGNLNFSADEKTKVDARNTPVATYYDAKSAEFSGENSFFSTNLYAAQAGTKKNIANSTNKIISPAMETITVKKGESTATLSNTPVTGSLTEIYSLRNDGTLGTKYTLGSAASATEFTASEKTVTTPTDLAKDGDVDIFVIYQYETDSAIEIINSANKFPKAGELTVRVLGHDVCDENTKYEAYYIFPNAKLDPNHENGTDTDSTQGFKFKASQKYCDKKKVLVRYVIPEAMSAKV